MSKKKITDPNASMEELVSRAIKFSEAPFTPDRDPSLPSLRYVAEKLGTTVIRTRKLLITANYFTSPIASSVQEMKAAGKNIEEIGAELNLGPAAVYGYLPFNVRAYKLDQTTSNADRHKRYRATKKLKKAVKEGDWSEALWRCVIVFSNYPFSTEVAFTYKVKKAGGAGGRHYKGPDDYGNEIVIEGKNRSISRSTVELGFEKYLAGATGPKQLGVYGASYLFPLFQRIYKA